MQCWCCMHRPQHVPAGWIPQHADAKPSLWQNTWPRPMLHLSLFLCTLGSGLRCTRATRLLILDSAERLPALRAKSRVCRIYLNIINNTSPAAQHYQHYRPYGAIS